MGGMEVRRWLRGGILGFLVFFLFLLRYVGRFFYFLFDFVRFFRVFCGFVFKFRVEF